MELSGKTAMIFSLYIIGEMLRINELFVDLVAASCVFIFIT